MEQKSPTTKLLAGAILALGIIAGCWVLGNALITFKAMDRYVTVKGLAEREVPADLAMWPISYTAGGDTLQQLDSALKASRTQIIAFLGEQGLGSADIMDTAPRIEDYQNIRQNNRPALRFKGNALLTVRSKDIAKVKAAMSRAGELVSRGVLLSQNYEYRPTFAFTGLNQIKPEMIAEATRNARAAAKQFADDSGSRVGAIRRATQGYFSLQNRDRYTPEIKRVRVVTTIEYLLEN